MKPWWGEFEVRVGQTLRWQIGPRILWITGGDHDCKIATAEGSDPLDHRVTVAESSEEPVGDDIDTRRFALPTEHRTIQLLPALPDRPLLVTAASPFFVPTQGDVTLFVSAPLWLCVLAGEAATKLVDTAIIQPSDAWFGPNTMQGELCYALRSSARLHLGDLTLRPHRSRSALHIRNRAKSTLQVEKLKIPVQNLALFATEEGHLWTEGLTLEREDDTKQANIHLDKKPYQAAKERRIAEPRVQMSKGFMLDTFGGLIDRFSGY